MRVAVIGLFIEAIQKRASAFIGFLRGDIGVADGLQAEHLLGWPPDERHRAPAGVPLDRRTAEGSHPRRAGHPPRPVRGGPAKKANRSG